MLGYNELGKPELIGSLEAAAAAAAGELPPWDTEACSAARL